MDPLIVLKQKLSRTNSLAFDGLTFDHKPIAAEIAVLKQWVTSSDSLNLDSDIIHEALLRFYRSSDLTNLRQAQLVCYGCAAQFGKDKKRLIEDAKYFPMLLDCIDRLRSKPRFFRRCYKGLLSGYFDYDPNDDVDVPVGKNNWKILRGYLRERLRDIRSREAEPDWVGALNEHANILTDDPTSRYGTSLLEDIRSERDEFDALRHQLNISDASWLVTQLVVGQVERATLKDDKGFSQILPRILTLLNEHRLVLNRGLSKVLERYVKCVNVPSNNALRDFAVTNWGIPWLPSNSARWSRVADAARQMVVDWLKLEFIQQFFKLLAEDGVNDMRRLKFWESYHKNIGDMYFALGPHARTNPSSDFVELRKKMSDRALSLTKGGSKRNNAFIMHIGNHVVVEFGIKGNACFIFERSKLPFNLDRGVVAGDKSELKHENHVERMLHIDTSVAPWEEAFAESLRRLMDIQASPQRSISRLAASSGTGHRDTKSTSEQARYSRVELDRFCATRKLKIEDLTAKSGNLWVRTDHLDEAVNRQLVAWGFKFKVDKGWWREKS